MPEYLAPGVYVEETSFRAKSIEGVGTSTTAFVGPTSRGPLASASKDADGNPPPPPELLTSFGDFVRLYGGVEDLTLGGKAVPNYLALGVLGFFNEGGARLYVARTGKDAKTAKLKLGKDGDTEKRVLFEARTPGSGGKVKVTLQESVFTLNATARLQAKAGTLGRVARDSGDVKAGLYSKKEDKSDSDWVDGDAILDFDKLKATGQLLDGVAVSISVDAPGGAQNLYEAVSLDSANERYLDKLLPKRPARRADQVSALVWVKTENAPTPRDLHALLFQTDGKKAVTVALTLTDDGADGSEPEVGDPTTEGTYAAALEQLRGLEDVSIVAAPGHTALDSARAEAISKALIAHAEQPRAYRIAVLDTPSRSLPSEAREFRSRMDSTHAALYYPWVTVANPLARPSGEGVANEINIPPSALMCGIYARNDVEKDVSKSPANEVVRSALRFESDVNFAQNQLLNPLGVNCLRFFPGRGYRVWGARTASSDPEWKYVNVRRYFLYLEASIDRGTQWAVFENNGPRLWQNIRETIEDFLYNEWVSNRLLGETPKQAYFVRCDRSTMTQNDLDNGRLICLIGVAALKPAEFVIFRIGQKTADARS